MVIPCLSQYDIKLCLVVLVSQWWHRFLSCFPANFWILTLEYQYYPKSLKYIVLTGWTGWICPILENYCGNFYLMSVLFFFVHLLSSPVTFYDISSDFWYWEIFFLSQIGDNPKGYPLEIFENDHSVFKKSFQISKCDAKTILKKSLKLT